MRLSKGIELLVIAAFVAILMIGLLVPIYADEVAFRMMRAGFFSEGQRVLTLLPQCHPDLALPIPLSMFPAAFSVSLIVSGLPPIGVRIAGLSTAFVWVCLLALLIRFLLIERQSQSSWLSGILAILGLGVLPLTLILARSEQWLLVLITLFVVFPLATARLGQSRFDWSQVGLLAVFCMAVSLAFYAHPKALFFLPLFAVSAYCSFHGKSRLAFWIATVFLFWSAFQAFKFAQDSIACPDAPVFGAYMASQTTKLSMLFVAPVATLSELWGNLWAAPHAIIKHLLFKPAYQSAWLPPAPVSEIGYLSRLVSLAISNVLWLVIWVAVLLPLVTAGLLFKRRDLGHLFFISLALWVGLVGHLAIYKAWNFYGGALVLGLAVLQILLSAVQVHWAEGVGGIWNWLRAGLALVLIGSAVVLATEIVPEMYRAIDSEQVGLKNQPISVPAFGFSDQRTKIREFAAGCSIHGDGARRLVVDDLTYFAFDNLREPLHLVYFYEGGFGVDVKGEPTIRMLERLEVEGIVAQCTFMPAMLMKQARKEGNLCCVKFPLENVSQ